LPEVITHSASLDRERFAKEKKARLARNVLLGVFIYLPPRPRACGLCAEGESLEFFPFLLQNLAILGTLFFPLWLAAELYSRRRHLGDN